MSLESLLIERDESEQWLVVNRKRTIAIPLLRKAMITKQAESDYEIERILTSEEKQE